MEENLTVWCLYRNESGEYRQLIGIFSSAENAKKCTAWKEIRDDMWNYSYSDEIYRAYPDGKFEGCTYFSVEPIVVDRLVE
jgi:hypothetical protein